MNNEKKIIQESFSDYELYQILEENGYTTTEKNLSILKEGLDSGKYILTEKDSKFMREIQKNINSTTDADEKAEKIKKHNDWVKNAPKGAAVKYGITKLKEIKRR